MKPNELRIGNYIHRLDLVSKEPRIENVIELQENKAVCSGPFKVNLSYDDLQPIPLTEQWLIEFGFEKKTYQNLTLYCYSLKVLSHGEISFHPKDSGFNLDLGTTTGYQFGKTKIKYVHQLQNLYFALTGEELTTT